MSVVKVGARFTNIALLIAVASILATVNAERGVFIYNKKVGKSVPVAPVLASWRFRLVDRDPALNDTGAYGTMPLAVAAIFFASKGVVHEITYTDFLCSPICLFSNRGLGKQLA